MPPTATPPRATTPIATPPRATTPIDRPPIATIPTATRPWAMIPNETRPCLAAGPVDRSDDPDGTESSIREPPLTSLLTGPWTSAGRRRLPPYSTILVSSARPESEPTGGRVTVTSSRREHSLCAAGSGRIAPLRAEEPAFPQRSSGSAETPAHQGVRVATGRAHVRDPLAAQPRVDRVRRDQREPRRGERERPDQRHDRPSVERHPGDP